MDKAYYDEMAENFQRIELRMQDKGLYLFGHCEATLTLADFLLKKGIVPEAILDNSRHKHGNAYKGILVVPPAEVLKNPPEQTAVLIVTRFYETMHRQLRKLGFRGEIMKLVDYNTYAEYSLTPETRERKYKRMLRGEGLLGALKKRRRGRFLVFCPFNALGDIYFCMSYLAEYMERRGIRKYAVCVPSESCASVVRLFGAECVEVYAQKELDALIQAVIYTQDKDCYIVHQDRPYVVNLHCILKTKRIPLEKIYCCGIFGLPINTEPAEPFMWEEYRNIEEIPAGRSVIISPYAKSVAALPEQIWRDMIEAYTDRGYQVFTNVSRDERALQGSKPLRAEIKEMKSVVERAGIFIGIRSGLCDVIRTAECKKIALYPDYHYCDTKWKAIDMYRIKEFENIVVGENFQWQMN